MSSWMMQVLRTAGPAAMAALLLAMPAAGAAAAQASAEVTVKVNFISSSGNCAALQAEFGFDVVCERPVVLPGQGGTGLGSNPRLRTHTPASGLLPENAAEAGDFKPTVLPYVESAARYNGVEISSWRLVSFHNGAYVELTIAW